MWDNAPNETKYVYRDYDSEGMVLAGKNNYTITFPILAIGRTHHENE